MKKLIMLSAFPASGKTTWAKKYKEEHDNVYIINSDEIRLELTHGDYHDRSKQSEVWKLFDERIHEVGKIENVTLILDALNVPFCAVTSKSKPGRSEASTKEVLPLLS